MLHVVRIEREVSIKHMLCCVVMMTAWRRLAGLDRGRCATTHCSPRLGLECEGASGITTLKGPCLVWFNVAGGKTVANSGLMAGTRLSLLLVAPAPCHLLDAFNFLCGPKPNRVKSHEGPRCQTNSRWSMRFARPEANNTCVSLRNTTNNEVGLPRLCST